MFNFEENALITISPDYPSPACGATRFRWRMHAALPFVLPTKNCINEDFELQAFRFHVGFHNHLDRLLIIPETAGGLPSVFLTPKLQLGQLEPQTPPGVRQQREYLQSVAIFEESEEYSSPREAFKKADEKIKVCFDFLSDRLSQLQRSLPYFVSWTVYPVSLFDVGTVHHAVDHLCPTSNRWEPVGGGVSLSSARQLRAPLFVADFTKDAYPPELDLANELLAEAQLALFRRLPRLAVLNSFTALETLANAVYKQMRTKQLTDCGLPLQDAEEIAETERRSHRTDEEYLLKEGPKKVAGRNLAVEKKALYDEVLKLEKDVRHKVSHRGLKPSLNDAKRCFHVCCEVVQWLSALAGFPAKDLLPRPNSTVGGFATQSGEAHVCSAAEMEIIARMFSVVSPNLAMNFQSQWFSRRNRSNRLWARKKW